MPSRKSASVESQVLSGIADSLWVLAWRGYSRSRAPATPPGAYDAAKDLLDLLSDGASQTVDQMWRAVEHLFPNPRAFGEGVWKMSQGESVRGMANYAVPIFDVEFDGQDLTWEGETRHAVQPQRKRGRKTARRDIANVMKSANLKPTFAGLNADWSSPAWHLGPSNDPNRVDGDYYIVEDEDQGDNFFLFQYFPVALNEGDMDEDQARVMLHEGSLDSVVDAARQEMTLRNNPSTRRRDRRNPSWHTRVPTIDELASALRYIEGEFRLKDGMITGEMWAEGLANGRAIKDPDHSEYVADARDMLPQLSDSAWRAITRHADRIRADDFGEAPRYAMSLGDFKADEQRQVAAHRSRVAAADESDRARVKAWEERAAFDAAYYPRTRAEIKPRGR